MEPKTQKEHFWNQIEENVGFVLLALMLVILSYQVIMRFIFNNSPGWTEELGRDLFIWFVYVTACMAIYKNAHIKIDALIKIYPQKARIYIKILGNMIFLVYAIIVTYYGAIFTASIWATGQVSLTLGIRTAYVDAVIPIAHAVMAIRLVQLSVKMLRNPRDYPD